MDETKTATAAPLCSLQGPVIELQPAAPLWQRVPTHDEHGHPLSDFMMLIPRLSRRSRRYQQVVIAELETVLAGFATLVVFVDLNFKLNLLWVSVRPRPGICLELPLAIQARVPEARLVAQNPAHTVRRR